MINYIKKRKGFTPLILENSESNIVKLIHVRKFKLQPSREDWFDLTFNDSSGNEALSFYNVNTSRRAIIKSYGYFRGGIVINDELIAILGKGDDNNLGVIIATEFRDNYLSYFRQMVRHLKKEGISKKDVFMSTSREMTEAFCIPYTVKLEGYKEENKNVLSSSFIVKERLEFNKIHTHEEN